MQSTIETVFGVDFSGAQDAEDKIWVTEATVDGERLVVESCERLADFDVDSPERERSQAAIAELINGSANAAFGLDFPFGLPDALLDETCAWSDVVEQVAKLESTDENGGPRAFYDQCLEQADGNYCLRETDARHAALCPYHWMIHKQTYYGLSLVLAELDDDVAVLPMESPTDASTRVQEVYPAATLEDLGLYRKRYKGTDDQESERREANYECLAERNDLDLENLDTEEIVDDAGGDALDSLVAAYAVFRNRTGPADDQQTSSEVEGHIYV